MSLSKALITIAVVLSIASPGNANLVRNAGFEQPVVSGDNQLFYGSGTQIGAWTLAGYGTDPDGFGPQAHLFQTNTVNWGPFNCPQGNQFLMLTDYQNQSFPKIEQYLLTRAGSQYKLKFAVSSWNWSSVAGQVRVKFGNLDEVITAPGIGGGWQYVERIVTATSNNALTFERIRDRVLLDDVSVVVERIGDNIALGRPVLFSAPPNYPLCADSGDATQLTDGSYVSTSTVMWVQAGAVGWAAVSPVVITIDLGSVSPIAGVSYSTAAGRSGVEWPRNTFVLVSDDGGAWRYTKDLMIASTKHGLHPASGYGAYKYISDDLQTRGRYLRLAVYTKGSYIFADEIEVYRGPDSLLSIQPTGQVVNDINMQQFSRDRSTISGITNRLVSDLLAARQQVELSTVTNGRRAELNSRLDDAQLDISCLMEPNPDTFRAVFPLNDVHTRILSVNAPVMRSKGMPEFFAWKKHRYDFLSPSDLPLTAPFGPPALSVELMRNEFRADSFLLTNASDQSVDAAIQVSNLPGSPKPSWLRISAVPWTDTSALVPISAALPAAQYSDGAFRVTLPSGMTCKVWLTVDSSLLSTGGYDGNLLIGGAGQSFSLPFTVRVSMVQMLKPRMSLGMWDYTNGNGAYGITSSNMSACIDLMRTHFLDSPWSGGNALPWPEANAFSSNNQLIWPLSFSSLDQWIARWTGARNYFIYVGVGGTFAGKTMGTEEFDARVGAWARALGDHMSSLGLKPEQLILLLVDEPYLDSQDEIIAAWCRAIKASGAKIGVFEDPVWQRPDLTAIQDAITLPDIICPRTDIFYSGGTPVKDYFEQRRASGQKMWFYQCSGGNRLDPNNYWRLPAWHAFRNNAVGLGFWAFGDTGGAISSWNEYSATGTSFTPVFLDATSATDGIHWQAVREGIEDYEYLAMLSDEIANCLDNNIKTRATALLTEALQSVAGTFSPSYSWQQSTDRSVPDTYRLRILAILEEMHAIQNAQSIGDAKKSADSSIVALTPNVVSAVYSDCFYIESTDRTFGIRVNQANSGLTPGQIVSVTGTLGTCGSGERCINNPLITPVVDP